jgi:hypothetical protein
MWILVGFVNGFGPGTGFILLLIAKGEQNFPPHQLFTFAVGSFFAEFVIRNPSSEASFFNITSYLIWHSLFGINEYLGTCEIITPLDVLIWAAIIRKGKRNFPPHQLFAFAVGSFFITFVMCNPNSEASFFNIISYLIRHSLFGINEHLGTCKIITPLVEAAGGDLA